MRIKLLVGISLVLFCCPLVANGVQQSASDVPIVDIEQATQRQLVETTDPIPNAPIEDVAGGNEYLAQPSIIDVSSIDPVKASRLLGQDDVSEADAKAEMLVERLEKLKFYVDYDKGFAILPFDKKKTPFDMRINGWIQFRHHGFARKVETWTDNTGDTFPVRNRSAFDIERARIYFKGMALDERLTYFYHLDGDSDGRHGVDFFDYWWAWKFSDNFKLQFGKRKVTASRQWLLGARRTRFVDRPMANDFFRPDRSIGLFGIGKMWGIGNYEWMIGNGYRTSNLPNAFTDDQLTYAITQYYDIGGDYGGQITDYDYVCDPLIRFGHSFVYSPITSAALGSVAPESDFIRLSDGTRLGKPGALAPGVNVSGVNVFFYGADFGMKYKGWSFNSEVFFRWLQEFEADGPLPVNRLLQRGYYVEGGKFLIPKKLDVNFRYSQVRGLYGGGSEYVGGFNWFPMDTHKLKVSFDVTVLDGSPLNNSASDILVGDDGTLFRTQLQAEF